MISSEYALIASQRSVTGIPARIDSESAEKLMICCAGPSGATPGNPDGGGACALAGLTTASHSAARTTTRSDTGPHPHRRAVRGLDDRTAHPRCAALGRCADGLDAAAFLS